MGTTGSHILFKTEEEYRQAREILMTPIMIRFKKGWWHRRHEVVLLTATGSSYGKGGRRHIWAGGGASQAYWPLVQKVLEPLDPYYTDDTREVTEFLGGP